LVLGIAIAVLLLLPFYYYGPSNDLAMRSSIPALMVLALAVVKALLQPTHLFRRVLLVCVLLIGALGALQEPLRSQLKSRWQVKNQYIPEAVLEESPHVKNIFPPHYFARFDSRGIQLLFKKSTPVVVSEIIRDR